jgi:two-component system LytT family response regulator
MTKLRVLIVDDEPLARDRLRTFLQQETAVEIAGECADGSEALAAIGRDRPDLVLLDMQMPGCDGLQVVAALPGSQRPAIVFVTAHERFALQAFDVPAIDYLLKPFDQARLREALGRAAAHLHGQRTEKLRTRVQDPLAAAPERPAGRLAFKTGGRVVFLRPDEIIWVEAANNHVILHLADARNLVLHETLSRLEVRLGPAGFARVNRSALVGLDRVKELQRTAHGDYNVVLENGTQLPLSRRQRGWLEKFSRE